MKEKGKKTPLPSYPTCYVCGRENTKGIQCDFFESEDGVEALFNPRQFMAGYGKMVHGGIVSAVLDDAIVWAVYAAHKRMGVTAELNIRFRKPVVVGGSYTVRARCTDSLRRLISADAEILDNKGKVLAKGTGRVMPFTNEQMESLQRDFEN